MWQHQYLHLRDPDIFPQAEIGEGISVPMVSSWMIAENTIDNTLLFRKIEIAFIENPKVPEWAREALGNLKRHLKHHKSIDSYTGFPLLSILAWWIGEDMAKEFMLRIWGTITRKGLFWGKALFQLVHGSIYDGENLKICEQLLHLDKENNTGHIVERLLQQHSQWRKAEYIELIEELLLLPDCNQEAIISHHGEPYSILDIVREYHTHEDQYNPKWERYGDYSAILEILERHGAKTASTIFNEQAVEIKIPLERIAASRSPFGDLSLPSNPKWRLYTDK